MGRVSYAAFPPPVAAQNWNAYNAGNGEYTLDDNRILSASGLTL